MCSDDALKTVAINNVWRIYTFLRRTAIKFLQNSYTTNKQSVFSEILSFY